LSKYLASTSQISYLNLNEAHLKPSIGRENIFKVCCSWPFLFVNTAKTSLNVALSLNSTQLSLNRHKNFKKRLRYKMFSL